MGEKAPDRLSKKALSEALRKLASEAHTIDDEGNSISKEEVLAKLVWDAALGWTEEYKDDKTGQMKTRVHKPAAWAMQYLYERLEGKVPQLEPEDVNRVTALDKVRDISKRRINKITEKALA